MRTIGLWQQCLSLLPVESQQHATITARIAQLRHLAASFVPQVEPGAIPPPKSDSLTTGLLKTGLSMALSIVVYQMSFGWLGAVGFVFLILIHEMGHVIANWYYGLPARRRSSFPSLAPLINLRGQPQNAKVEAIIGIAGPIAGTIASLAAFVVYLTTHSDLALLLSWFGFWMNLFNLLPVPPLDGGRVAAAISPWVWLLGLGVMGWLAYNEYRTPRSGSGILLLVLIFALPRIVQTLRRGGRNAPYYQIGLPATVQVTIAYLSLLGLLAFLQHHTHRLLPKNPF